MAEKVYFIRMNAGEPLETIEKKLKRLYKRSNLGGCFEKDDITGVKVHIGEKGNTGFIPPVFVKPFVSLLKKAGCRPFLTDTNVLYKSERDNAVSHLHLAEKHNYNIVTTGAPFVIADGLLGRNEIEVNIDCEQYTDVPIAAEAYYASSILVVTHVTAHVACGLASTIKNLGMGFSSRKGKLNQHTQLPPEVEKELCTGCGVCVKWCPSDAIKLMKNVAVIDEKKCISCGECIALCRFDAVTFKWDGTSEILQKRIAEHALGVMKCKEKKLGFVTFMVNQADDCDCMGKKVKVVVPDFGVLAGFDPVAIDQAVLDISRREHNTDVSKEAYPGLNPEIQLEYGEKIGLGTRNYELVEVK